MFHLSSRTTAAAVAAMAALLLALLALRGLRAADEADLPPRLAWRDAGEDYLFRGAR